MILTLVGYCNLCGGKVVASLDTDPHCLGCDAKPIAGLPTLAMEPPRKWERKCCRCGEPASIQSGSPSQAALMCDDGGAMLAFCRPCYHYESMNV